MTIQITSDEYLELNGVPLNTPAWHVTDYTPLLDGPEIRGGNLTIPRRRGQVPRMRLTDSRTVTLPIVIYGDKDFEGNAHADSHIGLTDNLNQLKYFLNMSSSKNITTIPAIFHRVMGDLQTDVQVGAALDLQALGTTAARGSLTLTIPSGIWRSSGSPISVSHTVGGSHTLTLNIGGTAEVFDAVITLSHHANSLSITNNANACAISYPFASSNALSIDAGTYIALDGATDVSGKIISTNSPFWLPLVPGANEIVVSRPGGGSATLTFTYREAWL